MKRKLYFNGNIITVDQNESIKEAVLVEDGIIKAVGTNEEILALKDDNTELVDLEGKTMLPGLISTWSYSSCCTNFNDSYIRRCNI